MNNKAKFLIAIISLILLFSGLSTSARAEAELMAAWDDHRFEFYGEIFVLEEPALEELYSEEELEDFSLYFASRELDKAEELEYTADEMDLLDDYSGTELNYEEILNLADSFTLIAVNAHRPFDSDTSHQRARVDVSEVVSINEGRIITDVTDHHMLLSEEQLQFNDSIRILPDGSGTLVYILPELETEHANIEIRSFLENEFIRRTVTVKH
ncbi:hypothetical protein [Halarsenatibacter silvermanii]|uniref:Uncharacterized protein n=1 Tax=Halarsenatibacter silvermanii TaxID=321763 RepID=A0A1G9KKW1_9FIRM|nr:hypothetical protein [Halarsenatibacter silvermanii]SDL50246.1 hypothetical protein SAMN04488692_10544 [Halarsenatibacter silvermanii]